MLPGAGVRALKTRVDDVEHHELQLLGHLDVSGYAFVGGLSYYGLFIILTKINFAKLITLELPKLSIKIGSSCAN